MTKLRPMHTAPYRRRASRELAPGSTDLPLSASSALVALDHPLVRGDLRRILIDDIGMTEVIEAGNLDSAIEHLATAGRVTMVIIGLELPGLEPSLTVSLLREHFPNVHVVVASACRDSSVVLRPLAAGAHGLLDVSAANDEIAEALLMVMRGRVVVPSWLPETGASQTRTRQGGLVASAEPILTAGFYADNWNEKPIHIREVGQVFGDLPTTNPSIGAGDTAS